MTKTKAPATHKFTLEGAVVPKARPRRNGRQTYLPKRYRDWKEDAISQLLCQRPYFSPIERAAVSIEILGNCRGDLDNLAGSVLDALVRAEIILDDRLSCIPALNVKQIKAKEKRVVVRVKELEQQG